MAVNMQIILCLMFCREPMVFPVVLACVTMIDSVLSEVFQQTCQGHYSDLADAQFGMGVDGEDGEAWIRA